VSAGAGGAGRAGGTAARDEVLARIRTALRRHPDGQPSGSTSGSTTGPRAAAHVPREYRTAGSDAEGSGALLDLFVERLVDYQATVHRCPPDAVAATVAAALADRGAGRVATPPGLPAQWLDRRTEDAGAQAVPDRPDAPLDVATLDGLDGVVTGCAVAIAQTGTIVLDGSPVCGRRALTLVPDYHLVVVEAVQVVGTVPEALPRLDPHRPLTWVSGPSATSDIELDRVEGVHGPRTLVVVLVEG